MSAVSFGSLLAGTAAQAVAEARAGVWRCSYDVDAARANVARPFGDGSVAQSLATIDAIVATAKTWAKNFKEAGKTHPLTCNMIETLSCLLRTHTDFKTGACEATYEMIAKATGFARATIHRHLIALRDLKWLDWVRRTKRTDEGRDVQTASQYFFEISRLPLAAQIHLRQLLKKKGITMKDCADRQGSGPVPNRAQRLAERLAKGFKGAVDTMRGKRHKVLMADAAFVRAEMEALGDVPTDKWAEIRHPGDLASQEAYNARLGIRPFFELQSLTLAIDTPLIGQDNME